MQPAFRLFSILALALLPSFSHATPQALLEHLHEIRLNSTNAITNFYMFSGLDADKKYEKRIEQSVKKASQSLADAESLAANNKMQDDLVAIKKTWGQFDKLLKANTSDILKQGFADIRLVDDMGRTNDKLTVQIEAAYRKLQDSSGIKPNPAIQEARELALLMEQMTSQYALRGTTSLGHVYSGNTAVDLPTMASTFKTKLTELDKKVRSDKTRLLMDNIHSKWAFIEERIRNFNENSVPFLVVSYNDRIVEHLHELEDLIQ